MAYTTRGGCGKAEACEVGLLDQGVVETCAGEVRASKKGALQIAAAEECVVQPGERKVRVLRHHAYGSTRSGAMVTRCGDPARSHPSARRS